MSLMTERDFESITVTDICERAMVHRTTFYKHFEDKYDLLLQGMQDMHDSIIEEMDASVGTAPESDAVLRMRRVFEHVSRHERFYRLMLCGDGVGKFHTLLRTYLADRIETHLQHEDQERPMPDAILAQMRAGMLISVIAWWLENDCPYTPAQMAQYMVAEDEW
ncbi:MAG: TetR/AcrR family transcriptional regulator [Ktedonobacteraceae bacterium]|nr:TetR/AcrR family transcriptional regulator [Ktedonobacteraceae bacterium]